MKKYSNTSKCRESCAASTAALVALLTTSATAWAQTASTEAATPLTEIVVTANRRSESAQSVPVSIQVLTGESLEKRGAAGFEDYLNSVSGVGFTKAGNGAVRVGIRGVSNVNGTDFGIGRSKSAVGLYLNDVPVQGAGPLPDLALYDLDRIEVLKGPQGTLYGEGAMGGAIKMLLRPADLSAFGAKADVGASNTSHGGTNFDVRGALNVPLIEGRAAVRLAATYRDNEGFIDNVRTGRDGVDGQSANSVRGLFDATITDQLTTELMVLHQHLKLDDFPETTLGLGDLQSNLVDKRFTTHDFDLYSLTLKWQLEGAELTSSSAYIQNDRGFYSRNPNIGRFDGFALLDFDLPGVPVTDAQGFTAQIDQSSFTQEVHVSSSRDTRLNWTVGAYFRSAKQHANSFDTLGNFAAYNANMQAAAADPDSTFNFLLGLLNAQLSDALFASETDVFQNIVDEKFKQYALFGEVDFKLTPKLSLKLGVRGFKEKLDIDQFNQSLAIEALDAALVGFPVTTQAATSVDDDGVAPRVGLSFSVNDNVLTYALASKGFRSGGPNFTDGNASVPPLYKSDWLWNYEVGFKSAWLDRRLILNTSLYYLDWKEIQVPATDPVSFTGYVANAGTARVTGGELQIEVMPSTSWHLGLNLGLLDSELTSLGPTVTGAKTGAELPNAPKTTGSAFLQYSRPLAQWGSGVARFDYQYVGRQAVQLIATALPEDTYFVDSYSTGRVQLGIENERWGAYLYCDNLWDERGELSKTFFLPRFTEQRLALIRPRTIGLRLGMNF